MRILALHGYQTSKKIFMIQSNYLRRILNKNIEIEWIIPDAPYESKDEISPIIKKYFNPPYYHWYITKEYIGIEESIKYIKSFGPVDGIIGFSQGGCFAQILSTIIKPRFIISICGINCTNKNYISFSKIPSLHIIGTDDKIRERSELLTKQFENPKIIYHSGKHTFPPDKEVYNQISEFIKDI